MLRTISDALIRKSTGAARNNVAIVDGAHRVTYVELLERALGMAALLTDRGLRKGDRVVIFLPRSVEAVIALFATWFAGGVAVMANEHLRTMQVRHIIGHSECSLVITNTRQILTVGRLPYRTSDEPRSGGSAIAGISCRTDHRSGPGALVYTSGSTGLPKGVMLSHDNLRSGAEIVAQYLELTSSDVILSVLPFSFDYGLNQLLTAVLVGGTIVIQRSLFPPDICKTIRREGITGLAGVPTLWLQLTGRLSPFLTADCPTLRYVTNSGGRLPEHTIRSIRTAHPHVRVYPDVRLTEAFRSTYLPPEEIDRRPSSMGKAIPNVEILVIREDGSHCRRRRNRASSCTAVRTSRSATGAIPRARPACSGRRLPRSGEMADTRWRCFQAISSPWTRTGYLYYVGRKDLQIKSRGVRVSLEEIERCIHASDLVSHVAAFAMAREDGRSDIVVAVIPHDPSTFHAEDARCILQEGNAGIHAAAPCVAHGRVPADLLGQTGPCGDAAVICGTR